MCKVVFKPTSCGRAAHSQSQSCQECAGAPSPLPLLMLQVQQKQNMKPPNTKCCRCQPTKGRCSEKSKRERYRESGAACVGGSRSNIVGGNTGAERPLAQLLPAVKVRTHKPRSLFTTLCREARLCVCVCVGVDVHVCAHVNVCELLLLLFICASNEAERCKCAWAVNGCGCGGSNCYYCCCCCCYKKLARQSEADVSDET